MNRQCLDPRQLDDKLSAWLDDELGSVERANVEAWLREHAQDAARLGLWAADREALRARLAPAADEPLPVRLEQLVWRHQPAVASSGWPRYASAVAAFAAGAAAGAVGMWAAQSRDVEVRAAQWERRAIVAHAVYSPEVRHPVEVAVKGATPAVARMQEEHLTRWLTNRLGQPVKLFDLRAQGYELVGGRLLPDANGPSAQLMYERTGQDRPARVTVYLRHPEAATPAVLRYQRQGELGVFYWVEGATGYALVGAVGREELLTLADAIYRQVQD